MDKTEIGKFLETLREDFNYSQSYVAKSIGVSIRDVDNWEKGRILPRMTELELLSFLFKVSVNDILCGKKNKKQDDDMLYYYALLEKKNRRIIISLISIIFISLISLILLLIFVL